ncbi:unnamed protein product [Durusdinium trenchii]|uniref:Uncharacterized protein n=2 Tax=Durusdinium trenchii TaxID=1381693 RepID=A0ABP0SR00_9DINO|eukprot:g16123.t1
MVIPVGGGLGPMGPVGPPPEEALRKLPFLKVTVLAVALVVVAEFVAAYYDEAISELLTPLMGLLALRDVTQTGQCVLCLAFVSAFNCLADITSLVFILLGQRHIAGAKYFFATECYGKVAVWDPTSRTTKVVTQELCSWQTVVGNCAIVLAILLEFICCRLCIKIFRAYQSESFQGGLMGYEGDMGDMAGDAVPPSNTVRPSDAQQRPAQGPGFVPFSGQGQRLV